MPTLLAIHAHPDDESSKGAATIARYSDAGVRCVLVTATGGEAGDVLNPTLDRPDVRARLADIRAEELKAAAAILGYDETIKLGYRDSGMLGAEANMDRDAFINADPDEVLLRLVRLIRSVRPEVMLGYDEHKQYPHPDHVRVHEMGLAAFEASADPSRFPEAGVVWSVAKMYAPVFSAKRITRLHEAMLAANLESPFRGWLEQIDDAATEEHALTSVHVGATMDRGRAALRAHATQVDPDGGWFQVPVGLAIEAYPFEDFELLASRVAVTRPESDLFAGV